MELGGPTTRNAESNSVLTVEDNVLTNAIKKMYECQTKAGNQEFQSLNVIENFENLKTLKT